MRHLSTREDELMIKFKLASMALAAALAVSGATATQSACAADGLQVGTAIRDVTPSFDMLPIPWGGKFPIPLEGVLDPVHVRVIAVSDDDSTALIISTESGKGPAAAQFVNLISEHTGLPPEAILYTATHSHAAPQFSKGEVNFDVPEGDLPSVERWARMTYQRMIEAVDEALADMRPATVGIGHSEGYINVNRRAAYSREVDGKKEEYNTLGWNPTGPSDKDVAVLEFRDESGVPIAFLIDYAIHGTVMYGNKLGPRGASAISSDIPGYASTYLEKANDGAVAIWVSGAAGDQNPIISNQIISRDPETGEFSEMLLADYALLDYLGRIHYQDIQAALSTITETSGDVEVSYDFAQTVIPALETGDYAVTLQLLRIGDIALVAFPGELFTTLGQDIKAASPLGETLVVTHAQQRDWQNGGYHADDESIAVGSFGSNAKYQPVTCRMPWSA